MFGAAPWRNTPLPLPKIMLFLARSPSFLEVTRVESKALAGLTQAARATHRPWLVLTYMLPGEAPNATMETACTQDIETLLEHLKQRPKAQPASLLYMRPPTLNDSWSRLYVHFVVRGKCNGVPVYLYELGGSRGMCLLDGENLDPEDVQHRKVVLQVNWYSLAADNYLERSATTIVSG